MGYTIIDDTTDDVVSTDDRPIITPGLGLRLECRSCGHVFDQDDAPRDIPGGHKKFTAYKCPECGTRCARKRGTNREVDEPYIGLSVREAFDKRVADDRDTMDTPGVDDATGAELIGGAAVDPAEVGDAVVAVFEYYPSKGVTNYLPVDADDVRRDGQGEHGDDYVFNNEDIDAAVNYWRETTKPINYPAEWDEDLPESGDDLRPTDDSILRFVRLSR
jgi:rubredoxin